MNAYSATTSQQFIRQIAAALGISVLGKRAFPLNLVTVLECPCHLFLRFPLNGLGERLSNEDAQTNLSHNDIHPLRGGPRAGQ